MVNAKLYICKLCRGCGAWVFVLDTWKSTEEWKWEWKGNGRWERVMYTNKSRGMWEHSLCSPSFALPVFPSLLQMLQPKLDGKEWCIINWARKDNVLSSRPRGRTLMCCWWMWLREKLFPTDSSFFLPVYKPYCFMRWDTEKQQIKVSYIKLT